MSLYGGSSTGSGQMALFDKPKVYADPEVVKNTLNAVLAGAGSTLGKDLDLEAIEKEAADEERAQGEKFMKKVMKMHELESFGRSSGEDDQSLQGFEDELEEGDANMTAEKIAEISFAAETTGDKKPDGLQPTRARVDSAGQPLTKDKVAAMKRRNSSRRRSSGLSSYDEVAYNMFGGDAHQFTEQYMTSKWKKEAKAMFEEAHGVKKTKFRSDVKEIGRHTGSDDGEERESIAESVEPGEVPKHTRMRLNRIDGVEVIRHELNVDGLYGGLKNQMTKNLSVLEEVCLNSERRLQEKKETMQRQHEHMAARKVLEERERQARAIREKEEEEAKRANGSSLPGIGDILNMDKKKFAADARKAQQEKERAEARANDSDSTNSSV
ncbi:hypothetical protein TeGR_g8239 [Tetraparma gracilis]|uniref:Uncharacterized protein n=1 Tax=Tetraparma gracilis TaxID=2962635 RepID=A0ABQ6M6W1_9STRA|nr:hypothetical protein TeGR_g8239 [Tetraparma gracilis]